MSARAKSAIAREVTLASGVVGALCCECGTFRTCRRPRGVYTSGDITRAREMLAWIEGKIADSRARGRRITNSQEACLAFWRERVERPYENHTGDLRCSTCGRSTRHALVLGAGTAARDETEGR